MPSPSGFGAIVSRSWSLALPFIELSTGSLADFLGQTEHLDAGGQQADDFI
ncbi:hypothetical protein D559_0009 [Bordetella holmesii 1058]|uniref:N-acetyltransferase YedL n=1 Tax=Bordetella holmesii 1058 TaxID=1247648 RepID=A0ABN0S506_9BORD|nr:hypothetical protein D559_0009 [Bordetella holmesii 1058]